MEGFYILHIQQFSNPCSDIKALVMKKGGEKLNEFKEEHKILAHFCRAMAHPARAAILTAIAQRGGRIMGGVIEIPSMANATVMQHLRELKRSGIIQGRIFGARCDFKIDTKALAQFENELQSFMKCIKAHIMVNSK